MESELQKNFISQEQMEEFEDEFKGLKDKIRNDWDDILDNLEEFKIQ